MSHEPGWGGLTVTPEMKKLLALPGYLEGSVGQKLRDLYQQESANFRATLLTQFGLSCYVGSLLKVRKMVDSGEAPDVKGTETAYQWSYITLTAAGSQRCETIRGPPARHADVIKYLISIGAPVNLPDIAGYTSLMHATMNNVIPAVARAICEGNADVDACDKWGGTAIGGAMMNNQVESVELLMEFGANLRAGTDWVPPDVFGPQITAAVKKWERKREAAARDEEVIAPLQEKCCDACGKKDIKLLWCGRCRVARYCTPDCQKSHWPKHKATCRKFDANSSLVFKPYYSDDLGFLTSKASFVRDVLGINAASAKFMKGGGAAPQSATFDSWPRDPLNLPKPKSLTVKVQVPQFGNNMHMLVYNRNREFMCMIRRADGADAYDRLTQVVREKGVVGAKAYFRAVLNSPEQLVIKAGDVLAEQPF